MQRQNATRSGIILACLLLLICPADAQVPSDVPGFPPAGYPRRTIRQVPGTQIGPSSGIVAPGVSTRPSGSVPSRVERAPVIDQQLIPGGGAAYRYWSPSTAAWDVQRRLKQLVPPTTGDPSLIPDAMPVPSGLPQDYGLTGSRYGLDALAQYSDASKLAAPPSLVPEPEPEEQDGTPAAETPGLLVPNAAAIPFEQFENYEQFRDWLAEQMAQPDGGAVGRSLERPQAGGVPGRAEQQSRQPPAASPPYQERPIIGYVGVGSNARAPIGDLQGVGDLSLRSARLASELNEYLRQTQATRTPSRTRQPTSQRRGTSTLPPPGNRSGLGGQSARGGSRQPYQTPLGPPGLSPQTQPRRYWQNLGGYQPPLRPEDWLPPGAGY